MTDIPHSASGDNEREHDPYFEPVITLPLQKVKTLEEDEDELFKMRAKLFRWASECDPPEWKERGTGNVKLLEHKDTKRIRIIMRRDKTLKICANHFEVHVVLYYVILYEKCAIRVQLLPESIPSKHVYHFHSKVEPYMTLEPNCGSDRAWVWNTLADLSDEEPSKELLAIRFRNAECADEFKQKFEECVEKMATLKTESTKDVIDEKLQTEKHTNGVEDEPEVISKDMQKLSIKKDNDEIKRANDHFSDESSVQNDEKTKQNGTVADE